MDPMYSNESSGKKSKTLFYVIIAIVVLLVIYWLFTLDFAGREPGETVSEIAPGETLRTAQEGELISGFPASFILEEGVVANESYSINYSESQVDQPVVTYASALTLDQNIDLYGSYLRNNGWNLTHEATTDEAPVTFYYAKKANRDVNITFNAQEEGVEVTIALAIREEADSTVDEETIDEETAVPEGE